MNYTIKYSNLYEFCIDRNITEIKNQYINLLNELTQSPTISDEQFYNNIQYINNMGKIIIAYVDTNENPKFEIIGSGTIIIEPKIIREGKSVGHIEDIIVKSSWRGKKIAQNILNQLKTLAQNSNCYKVILDCVDDVCPVYICNGFEIKGRQMSFYF